MKFKKWEFIISCEHGGNKIPFPQNKKLHQKFSAKYLATHRAYDKGALELSKILKKKLHPSFYISNEITRLLIDFNRSDYHHDKWGTLIHFLQNSEKKICENKYLSYHNQIINHINECHENNVGIIHLSVHSFTPSLRGKKRSTTLGLLFDPNRLIEKRFADNCIISLQNEIDVLPNFPYLGSDDGLTTKLRKIFHHGYIGIEIEVNQKLMKNCADQNSLQLKMDHLAKKLAPVFCEQFKDKGKRA